jgi:hypothetical protein
MNFLYGQKHGADEGHVEKLQLALKGGVGDSDQWNLQKLETFTKIWGFRQLRNNSLMTNLAYTKHSESIEKSHCHHKFSTRESYVRLATTKLENGRSLLNTSN